MSADNGIYIGKFKDGYKVIHASAIDNLEYHHNNQISGYNWAAVYDYYKSVPLLTKEQAQAKAFELEDTLAIVEYGISTLDFSQYTWNEIILMAKEKAREEIPFLKSKGWNSTLAAYNSILVV